MRLPRDVSGKGLAKALRCYGYEVTRQTGSHMRLTSERNGATHHVTIPDHKSLAVGTLAAVVRDVAGYVGLDRDEVVRDLFG